MTPASQPHAPRSPQAPRPPRPPAPVDHRAARPRPWALAGAGALAAIAAVALAFGRPEVSPVQSPDPTPQPPRRPVFMPALQRGGNERPTESPTTGPTARASATPTRNATPPPSPSATTPAPSPSPSSPAKTPGVPACAETRGDPGGLRFSRDGGRTLAANRRRLAPMAYTWDIEVDPREPDQLLELHEGRLYRSLDAGCTLSLEAQLPAGGPWDRLTRAPEQPDFLVASSVFARSVAWSEDGGASWQLEEGLPDDVVNLAIAADDPWHWLIAGRQGMAERRGRETRWALSPLPVENDSVVSAAPLPGAWGRWLLGSNFHGPYRWEAEGNRWQAVAPELMAPVGEPPEPVISVVTVWVAVAPGDADVQYLVVNRVGRDQSQRSIWRSGDGGVSWQERVRQDQPVGDRRVTLTGGTRLFVSPHDPDTVFLPYGSFFQGYGTDLFRSSDGLSTLEVSHFDDFYEVMDMAWGPTGTEVVFVAASSDVPSIRASVRRSKAVFWHGPFKGSSTPKAQ